jgi:hypothetical protein
MPDGTRRRMKVNPVVPRKYATSFGNTRRSSSVGL